MFRRGVNVSILVLAVFAAVPVAAQRSTCDLKLKVYALDAIGSPNSRVRDVNVQLVGKGPSVVLGKPDPSFDGFRDLKSGKYQLEFSRPGYMKRRKQVDLDCGSADEKNAVWNNTYLRRGKGSSADSDLMADSGEDPALNNAGISSMDVSKAAESKLTGQVTIEVVIDEDGNVLSASYVSGEKALAARAISMARRAKFEPAVVSGVAQRVKHNVTYNFGS